MNSNYLHLMHESFSLLHLDFSPSFLHSKKPKVQPLVLQKNILRGCLASKKKKIEERKGKQRELYFTKCKKIQYVSRLLRDDFHPSYSLYKSKACDWLITRIRKEFTSKKYKRKDLKWSRQNRGEFAPRMGWCEFSTSRGVVRISHKPGAVVFRRQFLPHFSSKSYTV